MQVLAPAPSKEECERFNAGGNNMPPMFWAQDKDMPSAPWWHIFGLAGSLIYLTPIGVSLLLLITE